MIYIINHADQADRRPGAGARDGGRGGGAGGDAGHDVPEPVRLLRLTIRPLRMTIEFDQQV